MPIDAVLRQEDRGGFLALAQLNTQTDSNSSSDKEYLPLPVFGSEHLITTLSTTITYNNVRNYTEPAVKLISYPVKSKMSQERHLLIALGSKKVNQQRRLARRNDQQHQSGHRPHQRGKGRWLPILNQHIRTATQKT